MYSAFPRDYKNINPAVDKNDHTAPRGLVRRIYGLCEGKNAIRGLFCVSTAESAFLPIPIDLALLPVVLAQPQKIWRISIMATLGSILGVTIAYMIGVFAFQLIGHWIISAYGGMETYLGYQERFIAMGWIAVAIAALTPVPFKFAGLLAGSLAMPLTIFLPVALLARFSHFIMAAYLIKYCKSFFIKMQSRGTILMPMTMVALMALSIYAAKFLI